jgi:hypothetical protein
MGRFFYNLNIACFDENLGMYNRPFGLVSKSGSGGWKKSFDAPRRWGYGTGRIPSFLTCPREPNRLH